jgi:hypothetical protein
MGSAVITIGNMAVYSSYSLYSMHDEENGSNVEMAKAERKQNNETSSWRI